MANVQLLALGHALVAGARGAKGGAPSKDSIWGVVQIDNALVKFFGRRGGALRYKTEPLVNKELVMSQFLDKQVVPFLTSGGDEVIYHDVTATADEVVPGLTALVTSGFYKARSAGKLNTRATAAAKKAKLAALQARTKA